MTLNFEKYARKLTRYFEDTVESKGIDVKVLTDGVVNVLNQLELRDYGGKNSNVISVKDGGGNKFTWNKDTGLMSCYGSHHGDPSGNLFTTSTKELFGYWIKQSVVVLNFKYPIAIGDKTQLNEIYVKASKDVVALLETILSNQSSRQGDLLGLDS